jgi:hypothetical protein
MTKKRLPALTFVDVAAITPTVPKQSDKYSWNLARWLRSTKARRLNRWGVGIRVICTQHPSIMGGGLVPFDADRDLVRDACDIATFGDFPPGELDKLTDMVQRRLAANAQ